MRSVPITCFATICSLFAVSLLTVVSAQTVRVSLRDGSITPPRIDATQGTSIHITVQNEGKRVHNFVVPDFYVFTQNLEPGETVNVSFTPSKLGTFRFYSDKNGKPEPGMEGVITVRGTA